VNPSARSQDRYIMPARASAANQPPLRDRSAIAEWSRSAAIVPHPGSWPGLSLRLRGPCPSSCPSASAGHFDCRAQHLRAHAFIRQILGSHQTLGACVSRWPSRPDSASAGVNGITPGVGMDRVEAVWDRRTWWPRLPSAVVGGRHRWSS